MFYLDCYIITDIWNGYNWLDNNAYGYHHVKHNHSEGSFGYGIFSSSIIENTWANLKEKIKRIYHQIPNKNFIIFLREAEWRRNMANKNKEFIIKNLFEILDYVSATSNSLYEFDELFYIYI